MNRVCFVLLFAGVVGAMSPPKETTFIGKGTNKLATALFKGYSSQNENLAFWPLGMSASLAIFAEGARGAGREEIAKLLSFPDDIQAVRLGYQSVLQRLSVNYEINVPEIKNYVYVSNNYSINGEYKEVLKEFYSTRVKSANRPDDFLSISEDNIAKVPTAIKDKEVAVIKEGQKPVDSDKKVTLPSQRRTENTDTISSSADSSFKIKKNSSESQMIIFTGFYYQGEWETPLVKMSADNKRPFFKTNNEKVFVETLNAEGQFKTADIPELKSSALQLKYKGDRYSFLLLIPQQRNGLVQLQTDLNDFPVSKIYSRLVQKNLDISVPTFCIASITKPISTSFKSNLLDVKSILRPELADLTGITKEAGLYVKELVQLVSFKVDSNFTEANFPTASTPPSKGGIEKLRVNQPFLFYLRDDVDGIIVVSGKVVDPTLAEDEFSTRICPLSVP